RGPRGLDAQVGRARSGVDVEARLDAAALLDPLVARVHEPREHVVGDAVGRDRRPCADDHGTRWHRLTSFRDQEGLRGRIGPDAAPRPPLDPPPTIVASLVWLDEAPTMLKPGDTAPDFRVDARTLYEILDARVVVLFFFPRAF